MRAFTLVEVLVGMILGSLVMVSLLRFSLYVNQHLHQERMNLGVGGNVRMAQMELARTIRAREPEFFSQFPPKQGLIRPSDHLHDGVEFARREDEPGDCAVLWDIVPDEETPRIYKIKEAQFPQTLTLKPFDTSYPPGHNDEIEAMSVLLCADASTRFCALVESVLGEEIQLAPLDAQPWLIPETVDIDALEILHLGRLEVTLLSLGPTQPGPMFRMNYQPWLIQDGRWKAKRRRSSYGHLRSLLWTPCSATSPDRLVIVGQAEQARLLDQPLTISGERFDREVICASTEF